jgi:hypothetical protein
VADQALIVFDRNPPIATPAWRTTIDRTPPTSRVARVRAGIVKLRVRRRGKLRLVPMHVLKVRWRGTDRGSGIHNFSIYVSARKGRYRLFRYRTTARVGAFVCTPGRSYRFFSVARDRADNRQRGRTLTRAFRCG